MRVEVYDVDDKAEIKNLRKQEFIGAVNFMMHDLIRASGQRLNLQLTDKGKKAGRIKLQVEQYDKSLSSNEAMLTIEALDVKIKSAYFYRLLRSDVSNSFFPVYQSESIRCNKGVIKWHYVKIPTATLFRDDETKPLKIELYEYSSDGNHKFLASNEFKFADLAWNYSWKSPIGKIQFRDVAVEKRASFLDYMFGGCEICLAIAIDFTSSNGDPSFKNSLHYIQSTTNPYMKAIQAIGEILQVYDSDKKIPVFGFGARLPGFDTTSHCFALNGDIFSPEIDGIGGVLETYQRNLSKFKFSEPSNFAEVIRYIGDCAQWHLTNKYYYSYFVLLIITDGQISDMDETTDEIVRCSNLPLSIIITGVGDRNFSDMDCLDADTNPLRSKKLNRFSTRDIVQFVPFDKFKDDPHELAKETLAELPKQLVDYMTAMMIPTVAPATHKNADFYASMASKLLSTFKNTPEEKDASTLIEAGFPVKDMELIKKALRAGYQNQLSDTK